MLRDQLLWNKTGENVIIPFKVEKLVSSDEDKLRDIKKAMDQIKSSTCIR